ncbi:endonuclease/exonuclease/phosphatase family protein [Paraglaciecola hydrolytica]|nr:endonuclease/exonuclease/phosphatase family protein [Paraglaciecola hydrolytica]
MSSAESQTLRVATFNVSMEATNYVANGEQVTGNELFTHLASGSHPQIMNIAAIIQQVRPDILLLNEFDYTSNDELGVKAFIKNYLNVPQQGGKVIDYPYFYTAPVNTGMDSGLDLDKDGIASGKGGDAFGFGLYPGQYGMVLLSRYPIETKQIRTFQHFLWANMPHNLMLGIKDQQGRSWYSEEAQNILRLSSKSHWDVPIDVAGNTIHILASHPTPPVFDGPEDRNGKRNHDEIRFWTDYVSGDQQAEYIYDDAGYKGGLVGKHFVVLGDLNASAVEGDGIASGIANLLSHTRVNADYVPTSQGAGLHSPKNPYAASHTAEWRMRADYVLPSRNLAILNGGVFWPTSNDPQFYLVKNRIASSDHRMVWLDIVFENRK